MSLDEISWMAQFSLTFPEILKNAWDDLFKKHANLVLVLCGSVSSWIRDGVSRDCPTDTVDVIRSVP